MAKVFLTKVWGFGPDSYPALGFGQESARSKYLGESSPGDWVILMGTKGWPTDPENQGKLLGIVQLGTDEIDVEAALKSIGTEISDRDYNDDGQYKWKYGLPYLKAFEFIQRPDAKEFFGTYLPGTQWAAYALNLAEYFGQDVIDLIWGEKLRECEIIDVPEISKQRALSDALSLTAKSGNTGPGPSNSRKGFQRESTIAYTYLLKLHGTRDEIYKIGYSADVDSRVASLNAGLLTDITGYYWECELTQPFDNENHAFNFEQELHKALIEYRAKGQLEIYLAPLKKLKSLWVDRLKNVSWI
jgi:predicted GIY-YIG superfamily endonuclease